MPLSRHSLLGPRSALRSPPAILAFLYLFIILVGGLLLWSPLCQHGEVSFRQALFTSTSAVTVTGLAIVDPGSAFTWFGEAVIMVLIQLGGLGIVTFTVMLFYTLGVPIGIPQQFLLREELNQSNAHDIRTIVGLVFGVSVGAEALGALALATVFIPDFGWIEGSWHAIFHSVSAFNNAGFALFPDGLSRYVGNPIVNLVVPALFITGGIGFIVLGDIAEKRSWRRLTLHSKMMLQGTAILIGVGFVLVAALEWRNPGTLGGLDSIGDRLWAAWFQAVTPRTAGFNTVDIAKLHDSTCLVIMALMVIGGGSTSTAGGIKVTTVFVLIMATVTFFRRHTVIHAFGRSVGAEDVFKVMALGTLSTLVVMTGLFVISISHDGDFLDLTFEVVSAFGTTGLSRGETPHLNGLGTTVIMLMMFFGRVGPLTLGFFLATRSAPRVKYPRGRIHLG